MLGEPMRICPIFQQLPENDICEFESYMPIRERTMRASQTERVRRIGVLDAIQFEFGGNYRQMAVLDKSATNAAGAIVALHGRIPEEPAQAMSQRNQTAQALPDCSSAPAPRPFDALEPWAFGIDRSRHGHPGKMDTRRGSLARSDGNALTTSLFSENGIFGIC